MKLSNKMYDILKWVCIILAPALITLISGLGAIYGYDTSIITATIGVVVTFVGSLIGISTKNYNKENE